MGADRRGSRDLGGRPPPVTAEWTGSIPAAAVGQTVAVSNSSRTGVAIAGLSLGTALNPLNSSMIAVALVVLRADFALDVATVTWVVTSFYLTSAAGQPLMGRLADRFGPRRLFLLGMALVAVTRAFMALGTATAYPSAVVMVAALARQANVKSTRPLGRIQMANTSAAAVGPVVGGLLVSLVGWEALFLINGPLALVAIFVVRRFAPADVKRERGRVAELLRDSDLPGIGAFIGALVLVMMALLNGLPELLQTAGGYDPGIVGLLMLPLAAISVVGTPFAVRAIDRFGVRRVLIAGVVLLIAASGTMWLLTASLAAPLVLGMTALLGVPYCVVSIASSQGMYLSTRLEERGVAAGIFQTCRYLGAITATVLIGIFYGTGVTQANRGLMVFVMLGLGAVVFVVSLLWREHRTA